MASRLLKALWLWTCVGEGDGRGWSREEQVHEIGLRTTVVS
jgi:hypothetical protein